MLPHAVHGRWDMRAKPSQPVARLRHAGAVTGLQALNECHLATTGMDARLLLWDMRRTAHPLCDIASPDGRCAWPQPPFLYPSASTPPSPFCHLPPLHCLLLCYIAAQAWLRAPEEQHSRTRTQAWLLVRTSLGACAACAASLAPHRSGAQGTALRADH